MCLYFLFFLAVVESLGSKVTVLVTGSILGLVYEIVLFFLILSTQVVNDIIGLVDGADDMEDKLAGT